MANSGFLIWFEDPLVRKIRYVVAAGLFIASLLITAFAVKFERQSILTSDPVTSWPDKRFSRVWVTGRGFVVGERSEGGSTVVEGIGQIGGWSRIAFPEMAGGDFSYNETSNLAAWRVSGGIAAGDVDFSAGKPTKIRKLETEAKKAVAQMSVAASGMVNVLFSDGSFGEWNPGTGAVTPVPGRADLKAVKLEGDYMSAAGEGEITLYRLGGVTKLRAVEQLGGVPRGVEIRLIESGRLIGVSGLGIWTSGGVINAPGRVGAMTVGPNQELLVAGDFDGVLHLDPKAPAARVAEANQVNTMAASSAYIVTSGAQGTSLRSLRPETLFSPRGKSIMWLAYLLLGISAVCATIGLFWKLLGLIASSTPGLGASLPKSLDVPKTLVGAFLSGDAVLWAGAGLSAQSGFPTRRSFIEMAIGAADDEQWLDRASIKQVRGKLVGGRSEEALDMLVRLLGGNKGNLFQLMRTLYVRIAMQSRAHRSIARLPWAAAVTTNYDEVLDVLGASWAAQTVNLRTPLGKMPTPDNFFLAKLWGDLRTPDSVLYCRQEWSQDAATSVRVTQLIHELFKDRTLVILGASVGGLLYDLQKLGVPKGGKRTHYLITGASGRLWADEVKRLKSDYSIEATICDELNIVDELPRVLEQLANQVADAKAAAKAGPMLAPTPLPDEKSEPERGAAAKAGR